MPLDILIEGLLFYKSTPVKKAAIAKQFSQSEAEIAQAITDLQKRLESGALRLLETDTEIQLVTSAELAPYVESWRKTELTADIGKAGAETLAIILYQAPVTRAEIDRIRGVNSSFIIRNLLTRGLIERQATTSGGQGFQFIATPALLAQLGVTKKSELTEFNRITDAIEVFSTEDSPA